VQEPDVAVLAGASDLGAGLPVLHGAAQVQLGGPLAEPRAARGPILCVMHGLGQRVRLLGAAVATIAGMALLTTCGAGWRQPAPGPPPSTSPSAIGAAAQGQVFYAQAASYTGQDAWTRARQQAQALRAKGFPAAVYSSHTEFPSHTLYLFIAVAAGQFPTVQQAKAQVERLRRSGFRDAKVFSVGLPK
jgi:hypothetical protein